jgi:hypothetical protein
MNKETFRMQMLAGIITESEYKQKVEEAKQVGKLYHFTYIENAADILKSNKLKASINDANLLPTTNKFITKPIVPHVSFTRYKHVDQNDQVWGLDCRITLDGNKMSNRYKVYPHSIFDTPKSQARHTSNMVWDDDEEENTEDTWTGHYGSESEMEERIDGDVNNIKDYILAIDINPEFYEFALNGNPKMQKALETLKELSPVPVNDVEW